MRLVPRRILAATENIRSLTFIFCTRCDPCCDIMDFWMLLPLRRLSPRVSFIGWQRRENSRAPEFRR